MAFVTESQRFENYKESRIGPGTYFYEKALAKPIDSWTLIRYHQNPFGSNSQREANMLLSKQAADQKKIQEVDTAPPKQLPKRLALPTAAFAVPVVVKENKAEREEFSPGPGAYQIPSFTEKLRAKVATKIIKRQLPLQDPAANFEEVGDWFRVKSKSTDSLPIFGSQSLASKSVPQTEEMARLVTDNSSREIAVKLLNLQNKHERNSSSFAVVDKGTRSTGRLIGANKGGIRWRYENPHRERGECLVNPEATDPQLYEPRQYKPKYKDGPSASFRSETKKFVPVVPWKKLGLKERVQQSPGPGSYEGGGLTQEIYKRNRIHKAPKSELKWHMVPIRDHVEFGEVSTYTPKLELPEGGKDIGGKGNRFEGFNYYGPKKPRRVARPKKEEPVSLVLTCGTQQAVSTRSEEDTEKASKAAKSFVKGLFQSQPKPVATVSQTPTPGPGTYELAGSLLKKSPGRQASERGTVAKNKEFGYSQAVVAEIVEHSKLAHLQLREEQIQRRIGELRTAEQKSNQVLAMRMSRARERREAPKVVLVSEFDRTESERTEGRSADQYKQAFARVSWS